MSEYYGVSPSSDFFAHYGIKGMRWGVRKAIESGNPNRLDRQYRKAQKKLARLSANADLNKQSAIAKKYGKVAKISGSIGAANAGLHVGSIHLQKRNWNDFHKGINSLYTRAHPRSNNPNLKLALDNRGAEKFVSENKEASELYKKHLGVHDKLDTAKNISGIIGAAGLGIGAAAGAKALVARHRTTTGGHAAAVAKRNEFKREMDAAFRGTRYGTKKRRR